jgi:hypothetical protein
MLALSAPSTLAAANGVFGRRHRAAIIEVVGIAKPAIAGERRAALLIGYEIAVGGAGLTAILRTPSIGIGVGRLDGGHLNQCDQGTQQGDGNTHGRSPLPTVQKKLWQSALADLGGSSKPSIVRSRQIEFRFATCASHTVTNRTP